MKLIDILNGSYNPQEWEAKGYELPKYDIKAVAAKTYEEPTWVHSFSFFRQSAIALDSLNRSRYNSYVY